MKMNKKFEDYIMPIVIGICFLIPFVAVICSVIIPSPIHKDLKNYCLNHDYKDYDVKYFDCERTKYYCIKNEQYYEMNLIYDQYENKFYKLNKGVIE